MIFWEKWKKANWKLSCKYWWENKLIYYVEHVKLFKINFNESGFEINIVFLNVTNYIPHWIINNNLISNFKWIKIFKKHYANLNKKLLDLFGGKIIKWIVLQNWKLKFKYYKIWYISQFFQWFFLFFGA
jgi:hypothetical protein